MGAIAFLKAYIRRQIGYPGRTEGVSSVLHLQRRVFSRVGTTRSGVWG